MNSASTAYLTTAPFFLWAGLFPEASPAHAIQLTPVPITQDLNLLAPVGNSSVQIRAARKMAGAIDRFVFRGRLYIDNYDHGRELQSALSLDGFGECYNPTEAGGRDDHLTGITSSRWLAAWKGQASLKTSTNMGFWLKPGTFYGRKCGSTEDTTAKNKSVLSNYVLTKSVTVGWRNIGNVLDYRITFTVPERRTSAVFESLTGYMPGIFSEFYRFDPSLRKLVPLSASDSSGEQNHPVVIATADNQHAMGVISPQLPQPTFPTAGYGRWRFTAHNVTKWNCVMREKDIYVGNYSYRCFVVFGTRNEVENSMRRLWRIFRQEKFPPSRPTSDVVESDYEAIVLYRFFNGRDHFLSADATEGSTHGYTSEGPAFSIYRYGYRTQMVPVFRCNNAAAGYHFLSTDGMCAGVDVEGMYGFISPAPAAGLKALHLFQHPSDHHLLSTTDYNEGVNASYIYRGIQGYVP